MAASAAIHMLIFTAFGTLCLKAFSKKKRNAALTLTVGYTAYFTLFELICVPMTLLQLPLSTLSYTMAAVCGAAILGAAVCVLAEGRSGRRRPGSWLKVHGLPGLLMIAAIGVCCMFAALYWDGSIDAGYYVGTASTAVYHNTLGTYEGYAGGLLKAFPSRYIFSAYPFHNSVVSQLLGIPAIVQMRTVMSVINVLMAALSIRLLAGELLEKEGERIADLMVCFALVAIVATGNSSYGIGRFLLARGYEGKGILAGVVFPMLAYWQVRVWKEEELRELAAGLFLCCAAAVCFAGSGIFAGAACAAVTIPKALIKRRPGYIGVFLVGILPILAYGAMLAAVRIGILSLKIG